VVTKIVGILNITPDSFFDGGKYNNPNFALEHCKRLIESGVNIIDIGAESTRPNAAPIDDEEELKRLQDILPLIILEIQKYNQKNQSKIEVSLDTRQSKVAAWGWGLGVDIINDVSGFSSPKMIDLAVQSGKKIVVMHSLGVPANRQTIVDERLDVVQVLIDWMADKLIKLQKAGLKKQQIIFDIGIGFGKNSQQSIKLLQEIDRLRVLDLPLYVGHSNKSFLDDWQIDGCQSGHSAREEKTIAVSKYLVAKNIEYLRVHSWLHQNSHKISLNG